MKNKKDKFDLSSELGAENFHMLQYLKTRLNRRNGCKTDSEVIGLGLMLLGDYIRAKESKRKYGEVLVVKSSDIIDGSQIITERNIVLD